MFRCQNTRRKPAQGRDGRHIGTNSVGRPYLRQSFKCPFCEFRQTVTYVLIGPTRARRTHGRRLGLVNLISSYPFYLLLQFQDIEKMCDVNFINLFQRLYDLNTTR